MPSTHNSGATGAPSYNPQAMQAARVRSRIALPDAMARAVASLAFGEPRDDAWGCPVSTAARVGGEVRL